MSEEIGNFLERATNILSSLFFFVEPAVTAPVNPVAFSAHSILVKVVAYSTLLSAIPATFVLATVTPNEASFAVALIFLELALVLLAIWPN